MEPARERPGLRAARAAVDAVRARSLGEATPELLRELEAVLLALRPLEDFAGRFERRELAAWREDVVARLRHATMAVRRQLLGGAPGSGSGSGSGGASGGGDGAGDVRALTQRLVRQYGYPDALGTG
jgi:hypothetical protein